MALPEKQRLDAAASRTSGVSAEAITTGSSFTSSSAIDNATNLDEFITVEAVYSYGTNPTAARTIELHILYAVDASNYEEISASSLVGSFSPDVDTSTHRRTLIRNWPLLPFSFKLAVRNTDTAQTITITLNAYGHSRQTID